MEINKEKTNLAMVDLVKYICAILIIIVHCERIIADPLWHHLLKNVVCRTTVPFFLVTSGYFLKQKLASNQNYAKNYLISLAKTYLVWSIIYLPFGIEYLYNNVNISPYLYPIALTLAFFYIGTYYHLWYISATIMAIMISLFLLKRMKYRYVLIISSILYVIGSVETYSAYLSGTVIAKWFLVYQKYLITPRNGLFYAMLFVVIGYGIYDFKDKLMVIRKKLPLLIVISATLMFVEGLVIFSNQGIDKNFLLTLPTFMLVFTTWVLNTNLVTKDLSILRQYSKYYFFLHPIPIFFVNVFLTKTESHINIQDGWIRLIVTLVCTHLGSLLLIKLKEKCANNKNFVGKVVKCL